MISPCRSAATIAELEAQLAREQEQGGQLRAELNGAQQAAAESKAQAARAAAEASQLREALSKAHEDLAAASGTGLQAPRLPRPPTTSPNLT